MNRQDSLIKDYNFDYSFNRRDFLRGATVTLGMLIGGGMYRINGRAYGLPKFAANPFSLGVASGDPLPDGIVIWTRLAPDPLNGGGMKNEDIEVKWRVTTDEKMHNTIRQGSYFARSELAHSVHVEVDGLQPNRVYWYQFHSGSESSPVGRTRTAPSNNTKLTDLSFCFVSCQSWQAGYYAAYKHLAEEDLNLVVHLGDYIYESNLKSESSAKGYRSIATLPSPVLEEITNLAQYRLRYSLYKMDPHLQSVHAAFPWIVTWDDHEVANNYAGDHDPKNTPREQFLKRRASAYQAYYEHMPLRAASLPHGADMQLYRRLTFGDLIEFNVLDTRQYRTKQPCGDGLKSLCADNVSTESSLMGSRQEQWLFDGLQKSSVKWNVLAQQVMMAPVDRKPGSEQQFDMDKWMFIPERDRVMKFLAEQKITNPVVITGDIHTNWVADLKSDFNNPKSVTVGTEFVGTSITSGGNGEDMPAQALRLSPENPHVKFFNAQRGYVRCKIDGDKWQSDYKVVSNIESADAPVSTRASFVVESGRPGAVKL